MVLGGNLGPRAQIAANVLLGSDWGLGDLGLGPQITAKVLPGGDWGPVAPIAGDQIA